MIELNKISAGEVNLGGSRLVLLEGTELGSRRHHHSTQPISQETAPPGSRGGSGVYNPPQNLSGRSNRRRYYKYDYDIARHADAELQGMKWANILPRRLAIDTELRKKFFKKIYNNKIPFAARRNLVPQVSTPMLPITTQVPVTVTNPVTVEPDLTAKEIYTLNGLLGTDEAAQMDAYELLGFSKTMTIAAISPNPEADFELLGEIYAKVEQLHGDMFGSEELLGAAAIRDIRPALSKVYVTETGMLSGDEFNAMTDEELLGFFKKIGKFLKGVGKGIGKVAGGIWKGVKGAGKFIGKQVGNVVKGAGTLAKNVGTGLWKGVKGAGKFIGKVVKGAGKVIGDVGKFALKNAGGLLKAGLSFLPGGGIAAGVIDLLTPSGEREEAPQVQEQQPGGFTPQVSTPMTPQLPIMTQMPILPPEQVLSEPEEYVYAEPADLQQYEQEYLEAINDPEQQEMTDGEVEELFGNFLKDVGKFGKKIFKQAKDFVVRNPEIVIRDPKLAMELSNKLRQSAILNIQKDIYDKNLPYLTDAQLKMFEAEENIKQAGEGGFATYGIWIAIAAVAIVFLMSSNKTKK
jgi:hypothetical protein